MDGLLLATPYSGGPLEAVDGAQAGQVGGSIQEAEAGDGGDGADEGFLDAVSSETCSNTRSKSWRIWCIIRSELEDREGGKAHRDRSWVSKTVVPPDVRLLYHDHP